MSYDYDALVARIRTSCQEAAAARLVASGQDKNKNKMDDDDDDDDDDEDNKDDTRNNDDDDDGDRNDPKQRVILLLQQAVEGFDELSQHCPMTPLLWMQYGRTVFEYMRQTASILQQQQESSTESAAATNEAMIQVDEPNTNTNLEAHQLRLQTLELGLQEFPGSALLQLHYLDHQIMLLESQQLKNPGADSALVVETLLQEAVQATERAIEQVGLGSHRNEGHWIVALFQIRLHLHQLAQSIGIGKNQDNSNQEMHRIWIRRAGVPVQYANDTILHEFQAFSAANNGTNQAVTHETKTTLARMEAARRHEAQYFGRYAANEDEVTAKMNQEGILANLNVRGQSDQSEPSSHYRQHLPNWDQLLQPTSARWGMGLGGTETARAFVQYANRLWKDYQHGLRQGKRGKRRRHGGNNDEDSEDDDMEEQQQKEHCLLLHSLVYCVYERAIAECPTIETLWLSYLRVLLQDFRREQQDVGSSNRTILMEKIPTVAQRAVRNCPYSIDLVQQQLHACGILASGRGPVLDPDALLGYAQTALDRRFVVMVHGPDSYLHLYRQTILVTQRHILNLLSRLQHLVVRENGDDDEVQDKNQRDAKKKRKQKQDEAKTLEYDAAEALPKEDKFRFRFVLDQNPDSAAASAAVLQEIQDLVEDLNDMYDQIDLRIRRLETSRNKTNSQAEDAEDASSSNEEHKESLSGSKSIASKFPPSSWHLIRAHLWKERAVSEQLVVGPLRLIQRLLDDSHDGPVHYETEGMDQEDAVFNALEKAVSVHNPSDPNCCLSMIQQYSISPKWTQTIQQHMQKNARKTECVGLNCIVLVRIRRLRFLFEKALQSVGRLKHQPNNSSTNTAQQQQHASQQLQAWDVGLSNLFQEWIHFEERFGSEESLALARTTIEKKRQKLDSGFSKTTSANDSTAVVREATEQSSRLESSSTVNETAMEVDADGSQRMDDVTARGPQQEDESEEIQQPPWKKQKVETSEPDKADVTMDVKKEDKNDRPTVWVNNLEYPAHPYTIRVSNLAPSVQDMDLVDTFRKPQYGGPIVHARIVREKKTKPPSHQHQGSSSLVEPGLPASKGYGLVQFEEKESVVKALQFSQVIGLHEQLITIERSQTPAVGLVPPGMHRVQPQGHGKASKRNEKKRRALERKDHYKPQDQQQKNEPSSSEAQSSSGTAAETKDNNPQQQQQQQKGGEDVKASHKRSAISRDVLAFRPRGVGRKAAAAAARQPKVRLALEKEKGKATPKNDTGK